MSNDEIETTLASLFARRALAFDVPSANDWNALRNKFQTEFCDEFIWFVELVTSYRFRGEILNVASSVNKSTSDSIALVYDSEIENGNWDEDLIPFYSIGNGDYFCLSARAGKKSPVYYVYHDEGRAECYSDSFPTWLRNLPTFMAQ
jgi:hypothetical protein